MDKNLFSKITDTPAINKGFLALWTTKAGNPVVADYIRNNYFVLAYSYAATVLKNKVSRDKLEDEVSELVLDTMNDIIVAAENGTLSFKGKAAFSTYIFSALKRKRSDKKRIYYPSEIKRRGVYAVEVYHLLLIKKYSNAEIILNMRNRFHLTEEEVTEYIHLSYSYTEKENNRISDRKQNVVDSYDRILEESPQKEKGTLSSVQSDFFKKQDLDLLEEAISSLNSTEKDIIEGHFLDNRWGNIKEMETELKLKNGVYEIKKAKGKLKSVLEDDFVLE